MNHNNNNNTAPEPTTNSNEEASDHGSEPKQAPPPKMATIRQVFSFGTAQTPLLLFLGAICAVISGTVGPFLIVYFAKYNTKLSGDPRSEEFMDNVKELAFTFLVLG